MTEIKHVERKRRAGGEAYTLEAFAEKYGIDPVEATDLFTRFGPSKIELDLLMAAKRAKSGAK